MDVVGYTRLSQEDRNKADTSLENQEKLIREFCERTGDNLIKIFSDGYHTGTDWDRPDFTAMLDIVPEKVFGKIIVKDDTRFARDQELLISKVKFLRSYEVQLWNVYGEDLTKNLTMTGIRGAISEEVIEKGKLAQRQMMTLKQNEGGLFGRPPLGYAIERTVIDGKVKNGWVVDVKASHLIQNMFDYYLLKNANLQDVAEKFSLSISSIHNILTNKKYIGIFEFVQREKIKGKVVTKKHGEYEIRSLRKIVNVETFQKVQEKLKRGR